MFLSNISIIYILWYQLLNDFDAQSYFYRNSKSKNDQLNHKKHTAVHCTVGSLGLASCWVAWFSELHEENSFFLGGSVHLKSLSYSSKNFLHCPAKTWIYLTPYVCTERIFDSRPFMYNKVFLEKLLLKLVAHIFTLLLAPYASKLVIYLVEVELYNNFQTL